MDRRKMGAGHSRTDSEQWLVREFEANRAHLKNVAYRILGSLPDAEDAVQESWIRLCGAGGIENPAAWLTTVVARICLDMLRNRKARREETLDDATHGQKPSPSPDPEQEALLADSVGIALMVVLEKLEPRERIAFVLHDMFGLPFDEIARIVERSSDATRQLASRARRRVQGGSPLNPDLASQRPVVDAFLAASRNGDLEGLLKLLAPDVVLRADQTAARMGGAEKLSGAESVARIFLGRAQAARPALVDGGLGVVVAPRGRLLLAMRIGVVDGLISMIEVMGDRDKLAALDLSLPSG